ncbi:ribose-5-phosphate isomerase [Candidatus Methanoperedens nitroreducens]|uniref:Ribose-5-phosphate isomerase A n=1 Tax=Candidatus Methanoperedens nitratireducens TaxID=1392998 RepID=A0A062V7X0_9EURY|nr:ribose-5-phosphate isomerase RpiA [Candidatus Methanoperedens nitroreducens]KCZ72678.1 ribose-5-phosphate isomerase [Candidatus Methanoperedens nitroreducens]MDJ1423390.1 ribose-5-phosphate isomerase RpiA [Candidatus Methanoperedens sp.]
MTHRNNPKQAAGEQAAQLVKNGMVVGLGTGSTTAYAIKELGKRVASGLRIMGVPTSYQSAYLAAEHGIPLTTLDEHPILDIDIDGADQIASFTAIKGGGGAHTREKIVALSSRRFVVVVDDSKCTDILSHPVPLEVIPSARILVVKQIAELGGRAELRMGINKDGPVISDNGNLIMDADFGAIDDPVYLDEAISKCIGVVEHGIFTGVDVIYIGKKDGSVEILESPGT